MKKLVFIKQVYEELKTIKEKATPNEINQLKLSGFNHTDYRYCIYGQMTGSCISDRAKELQKKSFKTLDETGCDPDDGKLSFAEQDFKEGATFTALEKYLFMSLNYILSKL